jgi:DNA-binding NtrC family response regulator
MREEIVVVRFSAAFAEIWKELAAGLRTEVRVVPSADLRSIPHAAAVVLAAGGAERDAIEWLEGQEAARGVPLFLAGTDPGRRMAAQAVARGATDYFALPEDSELLHSALSAALSRRSGALLTPSPRADDLFEMLEGFAGDSASMKAIRDRASRLLHYRDGAILIIGEAGTGKEALARALHARGPRGTAPFVPVDCAALPRETLPSDLFGYEKAAFVDAHAARPGLFELADGGTLFLDEIGSLPLDVQSRLVRVLESGETLRLGATRPRRVDVRVIATTSQDLRLAARRGTFRRDLQLRIETVTLELPPLRERGGDVLSVAERLLGSLAALHRLPVPELLPEAREALEDYGWPGNIRELKHALERALLLSAPGSLAVSELIPQSRAPATWDAVLPFPAQLNDIATAAARATLEACGGNVSRAARQLHVSRGRLRRLIRPSRVLAGAASEDAK